MNIKLEKAVLEDAEKLLEIQKECFTPHLEKYQDFNTNPALVTLERIQWRIKNENFYKIISDKLWVGSINIQKLEGEGNYKLHVINILPDYQNKGIGQVAIQLAESLFLNAKTWFLETIADMPNNRYVYEKAGYTFTGKTEKINDKLTIVFYKKSD